MMLLDYKAIRAVVFNLLFLVNVRLLSSVIMIIPLADLASRSIMKKMTETTVAKERRSEAKARRREKGRRRSLRR